MFVYYVNRQLAAFLIAMAYKIFHEIVIKMGVVRNKLRLLISQRIFSTTLFINDEYVDHNNEKPAVHHLI
jgi:hypothetical protein